MGNAGMMCDVRHPMMGSSWQAQMMMMTSEGEVTGCNQYGLQLVRVGDVGMMSGVRHPMMLSSCQAKMMMTSERVVTRCNQYI
jgi:hypothetical protein